ncbi:MAG: hypothetical protein WD267_12405 [Balneolales bacterium]
MRVIILEKQIQPGDNSITYKQQRILGHASMETTMKYLKAIPYDLYWNISLLYASGYYKHNISEYPEIPTSDRQTTGQ